MSSMKGNQPRPGMPQQLVDGLVAALRDRRTIGCEKLGIGVEQPAAVGHEQMPPKRTLDQVNPRRPRRRRCSCSGGATEQLALLVRRDDVERVVLPPI